MNPGITRDGPVSLCSLRLCVNASVGLYLTACNIGHGSNPPRVRLLCSGWGGIYNAILSGVPPLPPPADGSVQDEL